MTRPQDIALLKVDGLFFDKVYADMMVLLKSKKLGKKYLDMNIHLKELLDYLTALSHHPRLCLDPDHQVFTSEAQIYSEDKKLNHRKHVKSTAVRKRLYRHDDFDEQYTFPLVERAAKYMAEKLRLYKADQLPGGRLWFPCDAVKKALAHVEPTNDLCEGILGLNDWLQKVTPNLSQRTVSTMVEVLRNSTLPWFLKQDKDMRDRIINLARKRSRRVRQEDCKLREQRRMKRKRAREVEIEKGKARKLKRMKKQKEIEETEILTTVEEVEEALARASGRTERQQEASRVEILKKQLQARQPEKRVTVSLKGKKKTSDELLRELVSLLEEAELVQERQLSALLVEGARLEHRLKDDNTNIEVWYKGKVCSINDNIVSIEYEGYTDSFEWTREDLVEDFKSKDLVAM